jgi:hypothetical protein
MSFRNRLDADSSPSGKPERWAEVGGALLRCIEAWVTQRGLEFVGAHVVG